MSFKYAMNITEDQIKEIAELIDCGYRCFIHKQTGELISVPDLFKYPEMDMEAWSEENEKLENDFLDYIQVEPLESYNSFQIMENFAESLDDSNRLKDRLFEALNRKKPFREFKYVIDNSGEYRQQWFDFKNACLKDWVRKSVEHINL